MHRVVLRVCCLLALANVARAQFQLTTGANTTDFNSLATTGLPTGWKVFTGATTSALGTDVSGTSFPSSATTWGTTTGNFRNVASALNSVVNSGDLTATQSAYTNRAIAIRQTASFGDPGAAFAFNISTAGVDVSSISFSAQMLSVQTNSTAWSLQYGFGANPSSWTTLAAYNDPGAFGASTITVTSSSFGSALNNQPNVWLRVVALTATTVGGTRDTFGIDDFTTTATVTTSPPNIVTQPPPQNVTPGATVS